MKNFNIIELDLQIKSFASRTIENPEHDDFSIRASFEGEEIAFVNCYHESGRLYAFEVYVKEDYRRMGIASRMYDMAESFSGKTILPHHENPYNNEPDDVSDMALEFWKNRRNL